MGRAYVRWAVIHPDYYQVMFDPHGMAGPIWSLLHGVATLTIGSDLKHVGIREDPQALVERALTHSASWLTTPAKTFGSAAAAGTIHGRTGRYSLACSTAAVNSRYRRDIRLH